MPERNTVLRSMRDVGLAVWFGGSLMGAVGPNGAAKGHSGSWHDNARIASVGWAKWTPVNAAAIGAHLVGTSGLLAANASRVATQQGVAASNRSRRCEAGVVALSVHGPPEMPVGVDRGRRGGAAAPGRGPCRARRAGGRS
nr:hypothetical protein [Streptomyces sp. MB09-01]